MAAFLPKLPAVTPDFSIASEGERNQVYVILAAQLRDVQGAIPARHWTLIWRSNSGSPLGASIGNAKEPGSASSHYHTTEPNLIDI